jgi:hypothetical protein
MFSFEYPQLLAQGENIETEVIAGPEEHAETGEDAGERWNHRLDL